jgi:hypothetical protein
MKAERWQSRHPLRKLQAHAAAPCDLGLKGESKAHFHAIQDLVVSGL